MKHIDPENLRLLSASAAATKLRQIYVASKQRLSELGISVDAEPFILNKGDSAADFSFNERGVLAWIKSVSMPVRGENGDIADAKYAQLLLLRRLNATLRLRFND